jgi:hypothetical protein
MTRDCLQARDPGSPVAAQYKKLEASEKEAAMMQPHCETEDLKASWTVTGASLHSKTEESGI